MIKDTLGSVMDVDRMMIKDILIGLRNQFKVK